MRGDRLSAEQASQRLGVRRDTLYAYVSRGLIRSERQEGTRERVYRAQDVELLLRRRRSRRDPAHAAEEALHFGAPILESSLTLIRDGTLYYRGLDAAQLARSSSIEQVAALLWTGALADDLPDAGATPTQPGEAVIAVARQLPALEAFQVALADAAARDASAWDLGPTGVVRTGARILRLLAAMAVGTAPSREPLSRVLQRGWVRRRAAARPLLEAALVLWADHELNVGTFSARCVASARATPYAAVGAGLAALGGGLHGGATEQVEALFDEVESPERARPLLEARLRRGERIPGFGHSLYPEGDPRASLLLSLLRDRLPRSPALALADALVRETERLIARRPNVDLATAALRRALGMPPGSALALIGVARSVGWIAHALEEYSAGRLIRPRARYVGEPPSVRDRARRERIDRSGRRGQ